jgi:hypothetical protein
MLFAASVPIVVLANVLRIVAIAAVGHWFGHERAMQIYHDYSGYLVFGFAVLIMVAAGDLINRVRLCRPPRAGHHPQDISTGAAAPPPESGIVEEPRARS